MPLRAPYELRGRNAPSIHLLISALLACLFAFSHLLPFFFTYFSLLAYFLT